jgi:hypothetical protein
LFCLEKRWSILAAFSTKSRFNWHVVGIFVYRMGQEIGGKDFAMTSSRFESLSHPTHFLMGMAVSTYDKNNFDQSS